MTGETPGAGSPTIRPDGAAGRAAFAEAWQRRVAGTSYVPMSPSQLEDLLAALTDRLADTLLAEPFTARPAFAVGCALVDAHFTDTESLARTVAVLGDELTARLGIPADERMRARVSRMQGALAAGHSKTLRERALAEQQEIVQAALVARSQAERLLRTSEIRFHTVFAEAALGILIADPSGRILDANQALLTMLGYRLAELARYDISDILHIDQTPGAREPYVELLRGDRENVRVDKPLSRRDGSLLWTHLTMSLIRDDDGRRHRVVAMFEDVTDRHLLETRLRYLATHDPLTQLANRRLFLDTLEGLFTHDGAHGGARLGLCFLDLDGFKVFNDSFGHDMGDRLLVEIAGRLDKQLSTDGHLVARLGGDEFVILIANSTGRDQVIELAERALAALAPPVWIGEHELSVTASIGIVERPVAGTNPADVLRAADITLYWAKSEGKSRWAFFDPVRNAREIARYSLCTAMPAALARDEFFVNYQPVVGLADGDMLGVEALVRWRHPRAGLLGPDQFLGLAEETGLILALGRWLLRTACEQLRRWQEQVPTADLFINVHIGARQSRDPRLVDDITQILDETGLEPSRLQLELTRTALADGCEEPLRMLGTLAGKGIRIVLGDFGPGHANLACLRGLPAHSLKIDRGFVEALVAPGSSQVDAQIVAALVSLAHALGLTVTAEGVETAAQAERLRGLGCDSGQGRFLGPPGPPQQITRMLGA
jgi:diguanylate cyclase (GGDEF)-like protein/PAS domain S-box-containing protein